MSEMVERVAQVIVSYLSDHWPFGHVSGDTALLILNEDEAEILDLRPLARAVVAAMREPTQEMIRAGGEWHEYNEDFLPEWQKAIDAALEQRTNGN